MPFRNHAKLALLLLLPLAAACKRTPPPPAMRLLAEAQRVEVIWPDLGGNAVPSYDPIEIDGFPAPGRLVRVQLPLAEGSDTRAAILAPSGSRHRFRLQLPKRPLLRLAVAPIPPATEAAPAAAPLRFHVEVVKGKSAPVTVLDETLAASAPAGGWKDLEVELDRWAGKEVVLELAVDAAPGAPLAWGAWAVPEIASRKGEPAGYNVVLVSLDTLRADHLGCYGYGRPTSPNIDRLASESVVFATAVSQSPWTRPSHRALLTGLYPLSSHGIPAAPLAQVVWQAGYRTTALTGGGQVDHRFGFSTGFEVFRVVDWMAAPEMIAPWLAASRDRRTLLFLHSYEVHDPYDHPDFTSGLDCGRIHGRFSKHDWDGMNKKNPLNAGEKTCVEALYDGDIAFADRQIGALLDALERHGVLEKTILVLTSDHGEQFWEHGSWRHGQNMYDHQLHVPLIVRLPEPLRRSLGAKNGKEVPSRIADVVRLVDVYPTLLDLLGIAPPDHAVKGRSLRPLLEGGSLPPVEAFAENTNIGQEKKALRSQRFKFVVSFPRRSAADDAAEQMELYDLLADPREQVDISGQHPEQVADLRARIDSIRSGAGEVGVDEELPANVSPELRQKLEALGYVGH